MCKRFYPVKKAGIVVPLLRRLKESFWFESSVQFDFEGRMLWI